MAVISSWCARMRGWRRPPEDARDLAQARFSREVEMIEEENEDVLAKSLHRLRMTSCPL